MARQKKRDPVSVAISVALHALVIIVVFVWAARTGRLDPVIKAFDVVLDRKKEPEKPKEPEKKPEQPKAEEVPKPAETPPAKPVAPPPAAVVQAPSPSSAPPPVAPPAASLPSFSFSDGAKVVESSTNAVVTYYKNLVEYTLRSNWERPEDMADESFVAEIEVQVDGTGRLMGHAWKKRSGDSRWDATVQKAIDATKRLSRPPPKDFPPQFLVRFDVVQATEPIAQ